MVIYDSFFIPYYPFGLYTLTILWVIYTCNSLPHSFIPNPKQKLNLVIDSNTLMSRCSFQIIFYYFKWTRRKEEKKNKKQRIRAVIYTKIFVFNIYALILFTSYLSFYSFMHLSSSHSFNFFFFKSKHSKLYVAFKY